MLICKIAEKLIINIAVSPRIANRRLLFAGTPRRGQGRRWGLVEEGQGVLDRCSGSGKSNAAAAANNHFGSERLEMTSQAGAQLEVE